MPRTNNLYSAVNTTKPDGNKLKSVHNAQLQLFKLSVFYNVVFFRMKMNS